jgi:N-acetylneuraminic acid mutarotase
VKIWAMKFFIIIIILLGLGSDVICQGNIGIGTTSPHASALLDLQSNAKGLLIPRMTKTERNAIASPATGLLVFQTNDTSGFYSNTGSAASPSWKQLAGSTSAVPTGSIIISDQYPDPALTNAGFSIYRLVFLDSSVQYGAFGNWSNMDTTNSQYFNNNASQPPTASGGGYIYTYGSNNVSPFESVIVRYSVTTNTWQKLNNLPAGLLTVKDKPTFLWTGTELLIWGGNGANDGYRYNPVTNIWTTMINSNVPTARNFYLANFTGSELVIWGGNDAGNGTALNTGARYNLANNTWTSMNTTNAPAFLYGANSIVENNSLFVYGGSSNYVYSSKMNKYDLGNNTWTQYTPGGTSVPVRTGAGMMSTSGFIYVFGGTYNPQFSVTQFLMDGYVYNIATNSWSANFGSAGSSVTGGISSYVQKGAKIYAFGGASGSGANTVYSNALRVADITAAIPAFTVLGNAPIAGRLGSYVDTLPGNRLMFWGGFTLNGATYIPFGDGIIYNITTNSFHDIASEGAPPPSLKANVKSLSGKFVIWNMANAANMSINKGFVYTPDVNGFGKPERLKLYLFKKD